MKRLFPLLSAYRYHIGAAVGASGGTALAWCVTQCTPVDEATIIALFFTLIGASGGAWVATRPVLIGGTLLGVATYSWCFATIHGMTKRKD